MRRHVIQFVLATMVSVPFVGAPPAIAQETGPAESGKLGLEEVVVTAERREESLQKTPISVVALGPTQIEKLGISNIADLGRAVPNLQLTPHPNSASTPRVFIRGIGNFDDQITQDPSVAIYVDGVYVARNQGMGMEAADLERIEVLRGPQGTLYGRNATGGAINFITRAAALGHWGFSESLGLGNRRERRSHTMLNVPLGNDAAARFSYLITKKDGFVDNAGTGEDTFGAEDRDSLRANLRWKLRDQWEFQYGFDQSRIRDTPFYLQYSPVTARPQRPSSSSPAVHNLQENDISARGHQVTASWKPTDHLTLKLICAYRELDSFVYQDYLSGRFGPVAALITKNDVVQHQLSNELQLLGSALDDRFNYILGIYSFEEDAKGVTANVLPATNVIASTASDVHNDALATYAQGTYTPDAFRRRIHFTLGARWSRDERKADLRNSTQLASGVIVPGSQGAGHRNFNNVSPSFTIASDIAETVSMYAKATDGYKTGGFNARASTIARFQEGFGAETLRSYELGLKSQWWDNRLRIDGAVFRAGYDDIQINAQSDIMNPTRADILNAGKATIRGFELDLTALLTNSLIVALNYGHLDARYDQIIDGRGVDVTSQFAFVNAPANSLTGDVTYTIALGAMGDLSADVNYSWQDKKFSTASLANGTYIIDGYGLLNARLTLAGIPGGPGKVRVSAWGRNLADKEYPFISGPLFGGFRGWGEPRSYGVDVTYEY
jgi:iron complex outermembrane receptor protein